MMQRSCRPGATALFVIIMVQCSCVQAFAPSPLILRSTTSRGSNLPLLRPMKAHRSSVRRGMAQHLTMSGLSEKTLNLMGRLKSRPFFAVGAVGGSVVEAAFQENRYLTDEELDRVVKETAGDGTSCGPSERKAIASVIREQHQAIIQSARSRVYDKFPGIDQPGGGLYPAVRAEACWRDFDKFLQCVSYGTAAGVSTFTDASGAAIMGELYQEMKVPLDAMREGARGLREATQSAAQGAGPEAQAGVRAAEDALAHLITVLDAYTA